MIQLPPDSEQLADRAAGWRSAYIHVPFCARRCPYCDFAVVTPDEGGDATTVDRYVDAVLAEIEREAVWGPLDALNLGGGTPSQLSAADLDRLVQAVDGRFGLTKGAEVSIEVNPEDWSDAVAEALLDVGFNRVSFGVQSFDAAVLVDLGRTHTPTEAIDAVASAQKAGFPSINLDLIFGTPGESATSWRSTVEAALELEPHHLSMYALTVELGTALSRAVRAGAPAPDADDQAEKHELGFALADTAGLVRYEVSNAARVGHPSRYNLATWAQGEYLGFGLGAHGHRNGVRRRNLRRLDAYLGAVERGAPPEAGREELDPFSRDQERVMLGLRRAAGVEAGLAGRCLLASPEGGRLIDAGVIVARGDRIVVTAPLLTDAAGRAVLSLSAGDC